MCFNGFIIKINLFKSKTYKDGRRQYKIIVSSHLKPLELLLMDAFDNTVT